MPLFVYVCEGCGASSEVLVRGKERPVCPKCGSKRLTKQASAIAPLSGGKETAMSPCAQAGCCARAQQGACPRA